MRLMLLTTIAMIAFAANSVLNRLAVGGGMIGAIDFALLRLAAGAMMLVALVMLRYRWRGGVLWPGGAGRLVGVAGLLLYLFGFSLAYLQLDAGVGALILFGVVQITMFAGALWSREPVPLRRWLGAGLAFGGMVLLVAPGGARADLWHGGVMALAGFGWGIYSLAGRSKGDALAATAANFALALPVAAVLVWLLPGSGVAASASGLGLAVISGAVTSGVGYALWYALVPQLGAARAAVAQLTAPVLAALMGLVALGEGISLRFVAAAALVLGGVALASLTRRSR